MTNGKKKPSSKFIGQYPVIVHADESGGYWVSCPSFEGCYSQGETIDEALENIREAIELCVGDVPPRSRQTNTDVSLHLVRVPV